MLIVSTIISAPVLTAALKNFAVFDLPKFILELNPPKKSEIASVPRSVKDFAPAPNNSPIVPPNAFAAIDLNCAPTFLIVIFFGLINACSTIDDN